MSIVANVANVTIITKGVKMVHSGKLAVIQVAFNKVVAIWQSFHMFDQRKNVSNRSKMLPQKNSIIFYTRRHDKQRTLREHSSNGGRLPNTVWSGRGLNPSTTITGTMSKCHKHMLE